MDDNECSDLTMGFAPLLVGRSPAVTDDTIKAVSDSISEVRSEVEYQ